MEAWSPFFEVQAGASASLLGLVFVGLSINFSSIIASTHLPNRALEALVVLFLNLSLATLFLVPGQSLTLLGAEVLALVVVVWGCVTFLHVQNYRQVELAIRPKALVGTALGQIANLAWLASGVAILTLGPTGLYWTIPSFLLGYLLALLNAWVLLVEINR